MTTVAGLVDPSLQFGDKTHVGIGDIELQVLGCVQESKAVA